MLNSASANAPQSSRMDPPIDASLSKETDTYLSTGSPPENDNCRAQGGTSRSVTIAHHTSNLLTTADPAKQDSEGNTPLCLAAQAGDLAWAQQLIDRGADVHHSNLDGDNALTLAAAEGHLTFIEWLISHFWQPVDHENYYGETALTLAARHGHQPVVQRLVSQGASLEHLNDQLKDALAEAVANGHLALAQWLSTQDTDLRRVYPDGNNLFLHAVRAGHQDMAQWLENSGVDSQQINESGDNALTLTAHHGHHHLLARLLEKNAADIHQINRNGDSLLLMAARQGHSQTVKLLVQHGADIGLINYAGSNVLTLAATSNESLALWLCDADIDIHYVELCGDNAFTLAAKSGFFQLMQTLERRGINIHQVNNNNDNAFTLVARQGKLPWCQWLAGKGINIHQVNRQHHNAITLAALAGSQSLLEWLCEKDVDCQQIPRASSLNCDNNEAVGCGFNAAILAASAGHFTAAQWLIRRGLSIHQRNYFGQNAVIMAVQRGQLEAVKWFIAQGLLPDSYPGIFSECFEGPRYSAMSEAVYLGHLHIVQCLHQNGVSLDSKDNEDLLILAASRGDLPICQWLCQQGADLGRVDRNGVNALSMAVRCGHLRLSQWFVSQGAEDIPDNKGNDALMRATQGGHNAIFRWLCSSQSPDDEQANQLLLNALRFGQRSLAVWLCLKVCKRIYDVDDFGDNALMLAAKHGFLWLTQWLSEHTRDINQANHDGYTALMLAAINGHLPVIQWLYLEKNADLYRKNDLNADALQQAIKQGQTEAANWLIGQGMVLNLNNFERGPRRNVRWIRNRNNVGLLHCLLRQQAPLEFLVSAMLSAAHNGDLPVLDFCLSAGMSLQPKEGHFYKSCFEAAAFGGSLAMLEYLCHHLERDYYFDSVKKACLETAAWRGNLHIIQWFWTRSGLSQDEKIGCLLNALPDRHLHVVKWLHKQGADIRATGARGRSVLFSAVSRGDVPMLEWFYQQGWNLQFIKDGKSTLSVAIKYCQPQAAIWLFQHGCRLTNRDIDPTLLHPSELVMGMLFKMTSKIRRASLFHSSSLYQKLWILRALKLCVEDESPSEEEADARFARFNQYNDETLEQKCLVTLAKVIGQQSTTVEAGLNAVDSLSISSDCKFNLRELVTIYLENNQS